MTTSIYGDPRLFDLHWQTQQKAIKGKQNWKSSRSLESRAILDTTTNQKPPSFQGDIIHSLILEYLEGINPVGPSIHTFKLAMTNKKMMMIIKQIYNITNFDLFKAFEAK